jgi:hypothetical protein
MRTYPHVLGLLVITSAAGTVVGLLTWLVVATTIPYAWALPAIVIPPTLAGLTAGLGSEIALRWHPAAHAPRRVAWIAGIVVVSFLYGALVVALGRAGLWPTEGLEGATLVLVPGVVVAGVADVLAAPRGWPAAWLDGLVALGEMLAAALAFAFGAGLFFAITFTDPCLLPGHHAAHCLDTGPWRVLDQFLPAALAVGLWLGVSLWLALGLGGALRPRSQFPPRTLMMGDDASTPV